MAEGSLLAQDKESQLRIIQITPAGDADVEDNGVGIKEPDGSDAVMEDLNFMMFGDTEETSTADGMGIATIHWSKISCTPRGA